jgi:phage gpG-like protein
MDPELDWEELEKAVEKLDILSGGTFATGLMQVVAEMLVSAVSDRYESEGDGEWPPIQKATAKRKGGSTKIMQATGRLAGSTSPFWGSDFAEASTSVAYVVYHLRGGPIMPKRNPFEVGTGKLGRGVFDEARDFILDSVLKETSA